MIQLSNSGDVELEDETHKKYVEVIAEKVTFLSNKKVS